MYSLKAPTGVRLEKIIAPFTHTICTGQLQFRDHVSTGLYTGKSVLAVFRILLCGVLCQNTFCVTIYGSLFLTRYNTIKRQLWLFNFTTLTVISKLKTIVKIPLTILMFFSQSGESSHNCFSQLLRIVSLYLTVTFFHRVLSLNLRILMFFFYHRIKYKKGHWDFYLTMLAFPCNS